VPLLQPSSVLVQVLNGSGETGQATAASAALRDVGFAINGTGNAASFSHTDSVIVYPPGDEQQAETVASYLVGTTSFESNASIPAGVVDLILGASYSGVRTTPS
jgi:hypothetical protein